MNFPSRHRVFRFLICICLLLPSDLFAQTGGQISGQPSLSPSMPHTTQTAIIGTNGTAIQLIVYNEKRKILDRQAVVQATNKATQTIHIQVTQEDSTATVTDLQAGVYDLSVSAMGYLTSHQEVSVNGATEIRRIEVSLEKDPDAVDLGAVKSREISPKVRKDMVHGVAALKSGKLDEAQKKLEAAHTRDPEDGDVAFLLGYLYFAKQDIPRAQTYLESATRLAPHNAQALALLGRLNIHKNDFDAAQRPLEQAVALDPENWMFHSLLATVYLQQKKFEEARDQARLAIERAKGPAAAAQLTLGQALASLKQYHEATDALQNFLQHAPSDPNLPQVRQLIADIEARQDHPAGGATQSVSSVDAPQPMFALPQQELVVKSWGPGGVDDAKPQVALNVSCPSEKVINQAGERVKDLVDDLAKFDAIENVHHEDVDQMGISKTSVNLKFDYVASIAEPTPGRFLVDEFRSGRSGAEDFPDQIATRGLPTLAFIFHPDMRDNFDMTCEGLGTWNEKATWLVHFQQREDKPHRIQDYIINGSVYLISMKGRAWISADTYQIVRLESELVNPMPKIQLLSQHQIVDYAPVKFPKSKTELWLPKNAEIYFEFRKHRYFRRHSFDHFMLFSVDMEEKRKEPKQADKVPESRSRKPKHRKVHA